MPFKKRKPRGTSIEGTIPYIPPPKTPSKFIKVVKLPRASWQWEAAEKEYITTPIPPGMLTAYLTDLAARHGTTYVNLCKFRKLWEWDKKRAENAVLMELGRRAGEDAVRKELAPLVNTDTPASALPVALQHKMACDEAAGELTRRDQLEKARQSLIDDVEAVNTKVREIVATDDLTQQGKFQDTVNPRLLACKVAMDIAVRRAQIITALLGDPKKAAPGNVTNNLNLSLPEVPQQMLELQETMNRAMQFRAQPIPISGTQIAAPRPLTIEAEYAIVDPEEI
jgi:hypothetical protein